ncbi:hypothetical protein FK220_008490 [Flavobacteriaceae bacterium TP-CH-4]|uniref:Uncharacterized protein n=1 Tax=Pelagihabitans pacificus TaxID=2696054 RepID=A0A967AU06_9FLAO|nr:hypothetical protein [Pelagihabitans pacificus]NHF59375.1 hypothetical protein [Pelagihabitans pacificus]
MELDNIEKLLEKYFEAATTVAEEETLRTYFSQESVPTHLEQYAPMFQYFSNAKEERFTKQVPLKPRRNYIKWVSVAAVGVLLIGLYFGQPSKSSDPTDLAEVYTQAEIESAQEALAMLGVNFQKGTAQLSHLEEFEKTTNKFLTKE